MKKYFAVGYFAHPEIGMVTAGEVLSEKQAEKLGTAVIDSLLKRGALGIIEDPKGKKTGAEAKDEENGTADETKEPETVTEDEETETGAVLELDEEEAAKLEAELEAELPELEISADMVGEPEKAPKSSAKKTGGRRK